MLKLVKDVEVGLAISNKDKSDLDLLDKTDLSSSEETVLRLSHGLGANDQTRLKKKTDDPQLLARLLELEKTIMLKAQTKKKTSRE